MTQAKMDQMHQARMAERAETLPAGAGNKALRPERQEEVRAKIQATHIVNRLQQHGDGTIELSPTQIKAYEILLNKSLASLQATEITEVSKNDKLSEAEILAKIADIVKREPRLADMVQMRQVIDVPDGRPPSSDAPGAAAADGTCGSCGAPVVWGVCAGCGQVAGV